MSLSVMTLILDSTAISDVGYYYLERKLRIRFRGNHKIYDYYNVPVKIWNSLIETIKKGASVGQFFHKYIRREYVYKQVA